MLWKRVNSYGFCEKVRASERTEVSIAMRFIEHLFGLKATDCCVNAVENVLKLVFGWGRGIRIQYDCDGYGTLKLMCNSPSFISVLILFNH